MSESSFRIAHYYREALGRHAQRQWPDRDWNAVEPLLGALWGRNRFGGQWRDVRDDVHKAWLTEKLQPSRRSSTATSSQ